MRAFTRVLSSFTPAALGGAFLVLALGRVMSPGAARSVLLVFGAVYGVAVVGLIRLFRVADWGYLVAGLLAGPVPVALLWSQGASPDDRAGLWVLSAVAGLLLGWLEWARARRAGDEGGREGE